MSERKLVTIRKISSLEPIQNADVIELAKIDGWQVVVKKGEFQVDDLCIYMEIDSFLPESEPQYSFLMKSIRTYKGVRGHKLRTIKLKGQISQGLALPLSSFDNIGNVTEGDDLTDVLGIIKWEEEIPANLAGQAVGYFPSFLSKSDQTRCQNLSYQIFGYEAQTFPFNITDIAPDVITMLLDKGTITLDPVTNTYFKTIPAAASPDNEYEITMKMDGSSMTVFGKVVDGQYEDGVCSRNLQLKINEENADNAFIKLFIDSGLQLALARYINETGKSIAIQGELMGPGVQSNREYLKEYEMFVFDIYDINNSCYVSPIVRQEIFNTLVEYDAKIKHVPILYNRIKLGDLNLHSTNDLLKFAEGPSLTNKVREGLVFKRLDGDFSFKAISNQYLLQQKE